MVFVYLQTSISRELVDMARKQWLSVILVQNNKLQIKVSATLKIDIFPYLRFQRFQIGMFESFLLKKKLEENIISVERYRE